MSFLELAKRRYSVRVYKPDPVVEEDLRQVLEAARFAPTAANRQPFRILVLKTAGREASLKRIYGPDWFIQAPLVLAVCGIREEGWVRSADQQSYLYVDAAIVMDHIALAAADLGQAFVLFKEMPERQRACQLAALDQLRRCLVDAAVDRLVEMPRLEDLRNFFEGAVVGEDRAEQRRLDFRIMRRGAIGKAVPLFFAQRRDGAVGCC